MSLTVLYRLKSEVAARGCTLCLLCFPGCSPFDMLMKVDKEGKDWASEFGGWTFLKIVE